MRQTASDAFSIEARNISFESENVIHNDEGARALGYSAGLVSGATVYGYLTRAAVARHGLAWLEGHQTKVAFLQPVHHGDDLLVEAGPAPEDPADVWGLRALKGGQPAAVMETALPRRLPGPDRRGDFQALPAGGQRPAFDWDAVVVGRPLRALVQTPDLQTHRDWCHSVQETLSLYDEGDHPPLHPSWLLQQANEVVKRHFRMPPWIHVSSRILTRRAPRVGHRLEVRGIPLEKWEKGVHRFARLYVVMETPEGPAVEVEHKAILEVLPRG